MSRETNKLVRDYMPLVGLRWQRNQARLELVIQARIRLMRAMAVRIWFEQLVEVLLPAFSSGRWCSRPLAFVIAVLEVRKYR